MAYKSNLGIIGMKTNRKPYDKLFCVGLLNLNVLNNGIGLLDCNNNWVFSKDHRNI